MKHPAAMTLAELKRYRWRTKDDLISSSMRVPIGTPVTIYRKHNGVAIQGEKCSCCGVAVRMKIPISFLEPVRCPACGSFECDGSCREHEK